MKKLYLTVVLTLTCLSGLGEAHAQDDVDTVVANVPFEFVAGGTTLPAGTYRVSRLYPSGRSALTIQSYDNSIFVLPVVFDGASADHGELASYTWEIRTSSAKSKHQTAPIASKPHE